MRIGWLGAVFGIGLLLMLWAPAVYRGFGVQGAIGLMLAGFAFAALALAALKHKATY